MSKEFTSIWQLPVFMPENLYKTGTCDFGMEDALGYHNSMFWGINMKLGMKTLVACIGALSIAALVPFAHAAPIPIVTNGGFEAGNSPWGPTGDASFVSVLDPHPARPPSDQSMGFIPSLDANGSHSGTASQSVAGLNSLFTYQLDFYLFGDVTGFGFSFGPFSSLAGLSSALDFVDPVVADPLDLISDFTHYFGTFAGISSGTLTFTSGDGKEVFLDDVSINCILNCTVVDPGTNVPEPGTLVLVGAALAASALVRRRSQNQF